MPITLRTTEMAYRDNSGQYVGINGVSERTTAEQIAAVEAAGEHVLEDVIPHDWTELSEEFDDIKEKIVMSSSTEPDEENNRIWLKPLASETAIPTYEEFEDLKSALKVTDEAVTRNCTKYSTNQLGITLTNYFNSGYKYVLGILPAKTLIKGITLLLRADGASYVTIETWVRDSQNNDIFVKDQTITGKTNGKTGDLFNLEFENIYLPEETMVCFADATNGGYVAYQSEQTGYSIQRFSKSSESINPSSLSTLDGFKAGIKFEYSVFNDISQEEIDELSDTVDELEVYTEKLNDEKFGFVNERNRSYLSMIATLETATGGLAKTRRWFINNIFPSGIKFTSLKFTHAKDLTGTKYVHVEIWKKNSNTLTKVKTVTVDVSQDTYVPELATAVAELNYTTSDPCMICLLTTGTATSAVIYTTESTQNYRVLTSNDTTESTSSLDYSSLSEFTAVNLRLDIEIDYLRDGKVNVVTIGSGMDYEEIQDALEDITDDSISNPYTFLVMPKATPYKRFSTIRKLEDAYITSGRIRYISIIGVDKAHCIVRSDSGDYKAPCAEIMINGLLANMTFVMTNDQQTETAEKGGYCLHIDFEPSPSASCVMTIENCDFEDASGPCLGIGLRQNFTLTIRDCNLHTSLSASYAPHSEYRNLYTYGCLFAHTSSGATTQGQRIVIDNCFGLCDAGARSLNMIHAGSYDQSTADFQYTLMRNVFWNNSANAPAYNIDSDLTASPYNFGNNIP